MADIGKGIQKFSTLLNILAGCGLVGMTALTCSDVVLRLFRRPILGTYEIVEFLGASVAAFALAYTTLKRGHVAVAILMMQFSRGVQTVFYLIVQLVSLGLFGLLSWQCLQYGIDLKSAGEVSLTLEWPFYPVLYGMAFSSFIVCLVVLLDFLRVLTGRESAWYTWKD